MARKTKEVYVKLYDSAGIFLKIDVNVQFEGFVKTINGGLGPLQLRFARKFDTFNEDNDLSIGNQLKLYVSDEDAFDVLMYSGRIEEQSPVIDGDTEYVDIVAYGWANQFNQDILKYGNRTTFYTDSTSTFVTASPSTKTTELADVVRKILEYFNLANDSLIRINSNVSGTDQVEDTGNGLEYSFTAMTYFEALEKCRLFSPQSWYWYLNANNILEFKPKPSIATHSFVLKKDIKSIRAHKTLSQTKNIVIASDGTTLYRKYSDETSISLYGRRVQLYVDSAIGGTSTMNRYGESFVNTNKNSFTKIELEILDSNGNDVGYDIDSIEPGDTCKILNLEDTSEVLGNNMLITEVHWTPGLARLVIELNDFDIGKYLTRLKKEVEDNKKSDTGFPSYYTEQS